MTGLLFFRLLRLLLLLALAPTLSNERSGEGLGDEGYGFFDAGEPDRKVQKGVGWIAFGEVALQIPRKTHFIVNPEPGLMSELELSDARDH